MTDIAIGRLVTSFVPRSAGFCRRKRPATWVTAPVIGVAVSALFALLIPVTASAQMFTYTGQEQEYTVPAGITILSVQAVGGDGYGGTSADDVVGGHGGTVSAELVVTPGEQLYVEVGEAGQGGRMDKEAPTAAAQVATKAHKAHLAVAARRTYAPSRADPEASTVSAAPATAPRWLRESWLPAEAVAKAATSALAVPAVTAETPANTGATTSQTILSIPADTVPRRLQRVMAAPAARPTVTALQDRLAREAQAGMTNPPRMEAVVVVVAAATTAVVAAAPVCRNTVVVAAAGRTLSLRGRRTFRRGWTRRRTPTARSRSRSRPYRQLPLRPVSVATLWWASR